MGIECSLGISPHKILELPGARDNIEAFAIVCRRKSRRLAINRVAVEMQHRRELFKDSLGELLHGLKSEDGGGCGDDLFQPSFVGFDDHDVLVPAQA